MHLPRLFTLLLSLPLAACDPRPEVSGDIRSAMTATEVQARDAALKGDAAAANEAAKQARTLRAGLHAVRPEADEALRQELEASGARTRRTAELATEKTARMAKLAGWKARAHRTVDRAAAKVFFKSLSLAADQAGKGNLSLLPAKAQKAAHEGVRFVESFVGAQKLPSGDINWPTVSQELDQMSDKPPPRLRLLLTLVLLLQADFDLALFQIEEADFTQLTDPEEKCFAQLLRAVTYLGQGFPLLAAAEMEAAQQAASQSDFTPESSCGLQLALALYFLREQRWAEADAALVAATRAWPDNPVTIYLTGERLAADGRWVEAGQSFQKAVASAGPGAEWFAGHIATRMKQVRDQPGQAGIPIFDVNLGGELFWTLMKSGTAQSTSLRDFTERLQSAQRWADELRQKLPELPTTEESYQKFKELWK